MSTSAEEALWTRVRGDDWRWSFSTTDNVETWDEVTLLVQIRDKATSAGTLVATSNTAEDVTANITVAADFESGLLSWHLADTVTDTITAGLYWLEVELEVGGDLTTVLSHVLNVVDQVSVAP